MGRMRSRGSGALSPMRISSRSTVRRPQSVSHTSARPASRSGRTTASPSSTSVVLTPPVTLAASVGSGAGSSASSTGEDVAAATVVDVRSASSPLHDTAASTSAASRDSNRTRVIVFSCSLGRGLIGRLGHCRSPSTLSTCPGLCRPAMPGDVSWRVRVGSGPRRDSRSRSSGGRSDGDPSRPASRWNERRALPACPVRDGTESGLP